MTSSVIELSRRLQRSLDSNFNVIDLEAVFEIIRVLEGTPITTEQLETTRLAKYINQLRRKTTNEQLARQAKNLLKKWRDNLMPAIASGSQPPAAVATTTTSCGISSVPVTNGMPTVRSQPTTPSRPVLQQQNHHNHNPPLQPSGSSCDKVITIPDDDEDSKSLGASSLTNSRRPTIVSGNHRSGSNSCGSTGLGEGGGGGTGGGGGAVGLTIPTELTNFYLKNKKIIDGSAVRVVAPPKEEPRPQFMVDELEPGDVDARDKQKQRKGRKKGAKGFDSVLGSTSSLYNSNSNSGFPGDTSGTSLMTVGKKVKTTRQLVADLKFRNEQNLRNASYPDLSNDQEHNNNNGGMSSPMSASNDSQQHLFHHHHHNQHMGGFDQMFHSAPVTPAGYAGAAGVKREGSDEEAAAAAARKREKKRRKLEAQKLKVKKREKTPPPASGLNFLNQVDEDIWQLKNKLPPIDRKAILRQMKAESLLEGERQCTCEMVECSQEEAEKAAGVVYASLDDVPEFLLPGVVHDPSATVAAAAAEEEGNAAPSQSSTAATSSDIAVGKGDVLPPPAGSSHQLPPAQVHVVRNKRSIFDDDDVVMDEAPSPAALDKNNNSEEEGPNQRDERFPFPRMEVPPQSPPPSSVPVVIAAPGPPQPPPPAAVDGSGAEEAAMEGEEQRFFYKFNECPSCPVKRRKEDLVRLNPDYHLAALHQLYVPGVNGNWGSFPDLQILRHTHRDRLKALQQRHSTGAVVGKKRKRGSSESSEDEPDDADRLCPDNGELLKCWAWLQEVDTEQVEAVVPLVNPFFYFLRADEKKRDDASPANLLANMAGLLPRFVPLRADFGMVVLPPPVPAEGETPPKVPPPMQFNRELARELHLEGVREGVRGDVYDAREVEKFLEAMLRQRLPKFQMANLFYKRSWPGEEDRGHNLSLELLNSLYLNRVLEFRRRRRRRHSRPHRKTRRKSDDAAGHEGEEQQQADDEEEEEVNDVHVFDGFLEMQTMAFRNSERQREEGTGAAAAAAGQNGGLVAVGSARRLFYVNDDRLFGHQPSILDDFVEGEDPLPVLDNWDLFRVRWQSLEFLPPLLSATARILYSSWPRMRWNFLLDYFKDRDHSHTQEPQEQEEEEGGEVLRIHENNFRLPSFNRLTEENLLGVRQRRGRRIRQLRTQNEELEGDEWEWEDEGERQSVLPSRLKCQVESFRERDFVRVCMAQWPQIFEGVSFDYDAGLLTLRHDDVDTRWRFFGEFRELLREVTRLGVAGEEDDEEEEHEGERVGKNGFSSIKCEVSEQDEEEDADGPATGVLRRVDEPQVELFKEWHESVQVQSYNDELLTILPYVVID